MSAAPEREVTGIVAVLGHPEEVGLGFPWSVALARQAGVPLTLLHIIDPVTNMELAENAAAMAIVFARQVRKNIPSIFRTRIFSPRHGGQDRPPLQAQPSKAVPQGRKGSAHRDRDQRPH